MGQCQSEVTAADVQEYLEARRQQQGQGQQGDPLTSLRRQLQRKEEQAALLESSIRGFHHTSSNLEASSAGLRTQSLHTSNSTPALQVQLGVVSRDLAAANSRTNSVMKELAACMQELHAMLKKAGQWLVLSCDISQYVANDQRLVTYTQRCVARVLPTAMHGLAAGQALQMAGVLFCMGADKYWSWGGYMGAGKLMEGTMGNGNTWALLN